MPFFESLLQGDGAGGPVEVDRNHNPQGNKVILTDSKIKTVYPEGCPVEGQNTRAYEVLRPHALSEGRTAHLYKQCNNSLNLDISKEDSDSREFASPPSLFPISFSLL